MSQFNRHVRSAKLLAIAILMCLILAPKSVQVLADSRKDDTRKDDSSKDGLRRNDDDNYDRDRVILTFSTVGDSRQDPVSPDPSTLPVSVTKDNNGIPIGFIETLISNERVVTVNATRQATTVTTRDRANGKVKMETFYGTLPLPK